MKINIIASGSKGNCTIFKTDEVSFMIDCGIPFTYIRPHLEKEGVNHIFLTHAHSDHVSGIPTYVGNHKDARLYLTKGTYQGLHYKILDGLTQTKITYIDDVINIGDVSIKRINISHDCHEPVGYLIEHKGKKIVYVTDTGVFYQENEELIKNADIYMFESNYDPIMLNKSSRPYMLKQRISGLKGHLSNKECAYTLSKVIGDNTKEIVLMHLSRECNTKDIALEVMNETFKDTVKVTVSDQYEPITIVLD